ncbi:hypothetical protein GDO81_005891 [Engystomops pustulosus]|uniref:PID domain-containing protein n=1 Tax=Engystomops pustulosus TaxID=76066 RepID=A0AAV7CVS5_ENGPU|nr:hypothetical protein GDO81_005891 [Engystomops pustulosus]
MVFMQLLFVSQHLKAKASGKKLQKVLLKVTPRGIILHDSVTNKLIENVSIYRISYCTADKLHDKVFAYIAQSQQNETLECHAFLCTKRKMAQAVTLTVAQAFKVAFEIWQVSRDATGNLLDLEEASKTLDTFNAVDNHFEDIFEQSARNENNNVMWELDDGLDEAFSRLAESRTNPQVLDIGVTENDIQPDECFSPTTWDRVELNPSDGDELFTF